MKLKPLSIIVASTVVTVFGLTFARPALAASRENPECVGEWIVCDDDPFVECHSELDADAICATPCPNTEIFWAECDDVDCQQWGDTGALCYYGDG